METRETLHLLLGELLGGDPETQQEVETAVAAVVECEVIEALDRVCVGLRIAKRLRKVDMFDEADIRALGMGGR